jgi:hypothetical protein
MTINILIVTYSGSYVFKSVSGTWRDAIAVATEMLNDSTRFGTDVRTSAPFRVIIAMNEPTTIRDAADYEVVWYEGKRRLASGMQIV